MEKKSITWKILYFVRDLRSQKIFNAIKKHAKGDVLDIGGWDFYLKVKSLNINYNSWTTLEMEEKRLIDIVDEKFKVVHGDGCSTSFESSSFDFILCLQVLEHVFDPLKMVNEIKRILKPNGYAVFLIPQTSMLHLAPDHYYNFTKYWIKEAMNNAGLKIVEYKPLGGFWTTIASRLVYFIPQSFRFGGMSSAEDKRNIFYYLLYPFMIIYILINIPICMFLSLGDLTEEPNNHYVLVTK